MTSTRYLCHRIPSFCLFPSPR